MNDDIRIVKITPTGDIYKHPARYSAGNEWTFPIEYTLEDGRVFPSRSTHKRLKDAKTELATLPCEPRNHTTAIFHDGKFAGVTIHYGMITAWPVATLG